MIIKFPPIMTHLRRVQLLRQPRRVAAVRRSAAGQRRRRQPAVAEAASAASKSLTNGMLLLLNAHYQNMGWTSEQADGAFGSVGLQA